LENLLERLKTGLSSEYGVAVLSEEFADENSIRSVISKAKLASIVGVRRTLARAPPKTLIVVYTRDDACWKRCEPKCGESNTKCFGECFYECLEALRKEIATALDSLTTSPP